MTASTVTLTPGATPAPGAGVFAETPAGYDHRRLANDLDTSMGHDSRHTTTRTAIERAATSNTHGWLRHVKAAAGCTRPIRLAGHVQTIDKATGQLVSSVSTETMPDGQIYTPCGNRRAVVCPSCAETYRADTYQLIRAGLVGGKGVPETVASHPAVFVTSTAPSFGAVHTRRTSKAGKALSCRPRRKAEICPHGIDFTCGRAHKEGERILGQPYCLDCYDHRHQVVWNHFSGELWRRTSIALTRELKKAVRAAGVPFIPVPQVDIEGNVRTRWVCPLRISYAKVAEYQARGVVHFHALMRLDGHDPYRPGEILPPDPRLTRETFEHIVTRAFDATGFTTDPHPRNHDGWRMEWGTQLDPRPVHVSTNGEITDTMVAAYLAKYVTKATESTGHVSRRLNADTIDIYADESTHTGRLILACWDLGAPAHNPTPLSKRPARPKSRRQAGARWTCPTCHTSTRLTRCVTCHPSEPTNTSPDHTSVQSPYSKLRRWAHMLGFGGHPSTRSRSYSVTLKLLRQTRIEYARQEIRSADHTHEETTLIIGELTYAGAGWKTTGDALLANTAANMARSHRQAAKEEIAHEYATTGEHTLTPLNL